MVSFAFPKWLTAVVYRDMREAFLADDTDHGTRELREIFKRACPVPSAGVT